MSDAHEPTADEERRAALAEARDLLDAGLMAELITDTNRLAHAVTTVATELAADRMQRERELRSLRIRNGIQAGALALAVLVVAGIVAIGGARLTHIAEGNADALDAQTYSFLDAAFCVAELGFDDEAGVIDCYEKRRAARLAVIRQEGRP